MKTIYDDFLLGRNFDGKQGLFDFPSYDKVSMVVPVSLSDLARIIFEGVIHKPSSQGYFSFFPVRENFDNQSNAKLFEHLLETGVKHEQHFNRLSGTSEHTEHTEHRVAMTLDQIPEEAYKTAFDFSVTNAALDYLGQAFLGADLGYFKVNVLIFPDQRFNPEVIFEFYQECKDHPGMDSFNKTIEELGYDETKVRETMINATKARPILLGVHEQGQGFIAKILGEVLNKGLIEKTVVKDRHAKIFDCTTGGQLYYFQSSFFDRDLIATALVSGEQERAYLDKFRKKNG